MMKKETILEKSNQEREKLIKSSILATVIGTLGVIAASYYFLPDINPPDRPLAWSLQWIFLAFTPYAAVCLVILHNRLHEGSHNPLFGKESEELKIHCRVMQNNLEQWVWFFACSMPLTTVLQPQEYKILPILSSLFVIARLVYWKGYFHDGTLGRRYGVQMTFTINIPLLIVTAFLLCIR